MKKIMSACGGSAAGGKNIIKDQKGMSLAVMIALGFLAAVVLVTIIGVIVYFVKA